MDKLITVVVKPGQTFQGATYYEPTKFDVSPEYAQHLVESGIVTLQRQTYRPGQIVRYANPEPGEETLTFTLIEDNGDRVLIESRDFPEYRIAPTEVVAKTEIEPVHAS